MQFLYINKKHYIKMALKKFEDFFKNTDSNKPVVSTKSVVPTKKVVPTKSITTKKVITKPTKRVNESSFLVGDDYKVKMTFDIPKQLVKEYIDKVIQETGRTPLDNFNEAEIAEQMILYVVKQNMTIDNLPPDFTVGSENTSNLENSDDVATADSEQLSNDMGEQPDEEFEIESAEETPETDDEETGDIEFDMEDAEMGEDIEVNTEDIEKKEPEEPGFEEIEFEDEKEEEQLKPKTISDYLKSIKK